ncbi:hypothetical protein [Tropicibacter sp. S64]|uniref:hypothetical protein n=1 Tax=Tropicibacter sp. S64 TaxID=3415122 RepID=UPI003C7A38A3
MTDRSGMLGVGLAAGLMLLAAQAAAQVTQLSSTDSYINDELCVGTGCNGTEAYDDDTLTLKSTFLKVLFDDTSASTAADRDWSIQTNLTSSEEFVIEDETTGAKPFQIAGGAPESAVYVGSNGYVGIGTTIPQGELHIVDPVSRTVSLVLQADVPSVSKMLMSYTGSALLFSDFDLGNAVLRMSMSAPSNAMTIGSNGNIGFGTSLPFYAMHLLRTDGTATIRVENTAASGQAAREMFRMDNYGGSYFTLANSQSNKDWYFVHENAAAGRFFINHSDGGRQMALDPAGNMTIEGQLFTAGSCSAGCDRVFDADYPLPSIAEQAASMKANKHLPNVGPTPEDGPFNLTAMTGGMLNELEKAHLYIGQLHEENAAQAAEIAALRAELAELPGIVARLEALEGR